MADDLSLLLKIRGDAAGGKAAIAETRAAIATLRSQMGSDFKAIQSAGESALAGIGSHLNVFVGERLPLLGGSFIRVSENLRGFSEESKKGEAELSKFQKTVDNLSTSTGKSKSELINFLTGFVQLETQAKRDSAAIETFGATAAQKLIPQLEKAGTELSQIAESSGSAASGLASMAGPIGIAVLAMAALTVGAVLLSKEFFDLTAATAEFEGKLFDLSQQTGVSVETLSALQILAQTTGSDISQIAAALGIFQKNLEAAHDPTSKQAALLENLGLQANNTEDALRQSLKILYAMPEGYRQTALALELYGRGGKSLLAILKETNGDLDGSIKRFREMGILISTEDAEAADKFNDQLAILGFQTRAISAVLVREAIPALTSIAGGLKDNLSAIHDVASALGELTIFITKPLQGALATAKAGVDALGEAWLQARRYALLYQGVPLEMAALVPPSTSPGTTTPSTSRDTGETPGTGKAFRAQEAQVEALKQLAEEQQRISQDAIAKSAALFKQGQISLQQDTNIKIGEFKKQKDAQVDAINAQIALKQKEQENRKDDLSEQRKLETDIAKLRQDARNAESQFLRDKESEEINAEQTRIKNLIEHLDFVVGLRQRANDAEIKAIEARVKSGELLAQDGEDRIEQIESIGLEARRTALAQEGRLLHLSADDRKSIEQKFATFEQDRTETLRLQAERRKQIARDEADERLRILQEFSRQQLSLQSAADETAIIQVRDLAAVRVITERQAAEQILRIRLDAIARQLKANEDAGKVADTIVDPKKQKELRSALSAADKLLFEQRKQIQLQGNQELEAGDKKDIEVRRRYVDQIKSLDARIAESNMAQRRADLETVAQRYGLNAQIIAAFRQLTFEEETERHKRIASEIDAQEAEAHAVDVGNKNRLEIEERFNRLREQENKRFHGSQDKINKPGGAGVSGRSPLSQLAQLQDQLTEKFSGKALTAAQAGVQALTTAFEGLGQALGNVIQSFVLYGTAGTTFRKVTAEILASIAQQATVQAVFQLAEGFAALARAWLGDPAAAEEAHNHFISAAIYGSVAGVAAIAGRGIAGNSFANQGAGSSSGGGSGGSLSASSSNSTSPIVLGSQRPMTVHIVFENKPGSMFNTHIANAVVQNAEGGGVVRQAIVKEIKRQE